MLYKFIRTPLEGVYARKGRGKGEREREGEKKTSAEVHRSSVHTYPAFPATRHPRPFTESSSLVEICFLCFQYAAFISGEWW